MMLGINALLDDKRGWTYTFFALAVGCRPFSALYIIAAFIYFVLKDRNNGMNFGKMVKNNFLPLIPMMIIAIIYMSYNYARFRNPIEFGHNYLPEFTKTNTVKFSFRYVMDNLRGYLNPGIKFDDKLHVSFDQPFNFLIANPILFVGLYHAIKEDVKNKKICATRLIFIASVLVNFLLLCMHKTLGAWQFGARYTCDLIPIMFLTLFFVRKHSEENGEGLVLKGEKIERISLDKFELSMIAFGIILNVFGAVIMWS